MTQRDASSLSLAGLAAAASSSPPPAQPIASRGPGFASGAAAAAVDLVRIAELVGARAVDGITPALVQQDEEDHVISQARDAVGRGHRHEHRKGVVHECVERLVEEHAPGQVRDRFELIVDEELRRHAHEAEEVDALGGCT
eukprot:CAMPEP_0119424216 /NCGR_PEP_ID=MMETSP1335-20130426/32027_1 /TAXON_ID=259385 /ORGANISM="Chrysoculter rhomboideus, Strain RCC1486" /LENGTH=140 /DNA_ID=CAMNT_0007449731 /DNA_START=70 /DNA_END=487 /DNA_ORIENTATION=+